MTLNNAIDSIVGSTTRTAAKRPSWAGYVKVSGYNSTTSAYNLTFVTGAATAAQIENATVSDSGTSADPTDDVGAFVLSYDGTGWTMPSAALALDAELWASLIADDWIVGSAADFETARTGGTGRW